MIQVAQPLWPHEEQSYGVVFGAVPTIEEAAGEAEEETGVVEEEGMANRILFIAGYRIWQGKLPYTLCGIAEVSRFSQEGVSGCRRRCVLGCER